MSAAPFTPVALKAQELGCDRGGRAVFRQLSFSLESGQALVLRGANGAGKTSLLRLVAGLCPMAEGRLQMRLGDADWQDGNAAGHIAWQGHQDAHKAPLSLRENLRFWCRLHGGAARQMIDAALERTGLLALADMPAGQTSAGQKRRLALARLLVQNQPLWLLDEPTASLDAEAAKMSEALTGEHLRQGGAALIATHSAYAPPGRVSALELVHAA